MFYHIEGTVTELEQNLVIIDCGGIGFALNTTANTMSQIKISEKAKLYIAEAIGENNFDLYGFYSKNEKRCFEMLVSVSGVGPKAAVSILSYSTPEALAMAIANNDEKALTVAPGIGKKIAQRVILELKDKVRKEMSGSEIQLPVINSTSEQDSPLNDAITALSVLGYNSSEISSALKNTDVTGMTAEQIIKSVLKQMIKKQ